MDKTTIAFVKNALRRASNKWGPIWKIKKKARRKYIGHRKRQKFEYKCNECTKYYPSSQVQVDHVVPVGACNLGSELIDFIERLLCSESGLQVLCIKCHQKKTNKDILYRLR